jgi:hypothetical protein
MDMNSLLGALPVGIGATALLDLATIARKRLLGIALPDYGLVGRWIGHMAQLRFRHQRIASVAPVRGEQQIGWLTHYLVGIAFAALLPGLWGMAWIRHPTLGPALIVGIGSVAAPFLVMQPAMGAGFAASRAARPSAARLQSLITHAIFGIGLYVSGCINDFFYRSLS